MPSKQFACVRQPSRHASGDPSQILPALHFVSSWQPATQVEVPLTSQSISIGQSVCVLHPARHIRLVASQIWPPPQVVSPRHPMRHVRVPASQMLPAPHSPSVLQPTRHTSLVASHTSPALHAVSARHPSRQRAASQIRPLVHRASLEHPLTHVKLSEQISSLAQPLSSRQPTRHARDSHTKPGSQFGSVRQPSLQVIVERSQYEPRGHGHDAGNVTCVSRRLASKTGRPESTDTLGSIPESGKS